jgi:acyl-CoA synthetase (AMP-forming)/AMP-acid ligase II
MSPEAFLADPRIWMRACSEYRATSTTSPPFALRLAARTLRPSSIDLSSLRSFVVGSEPVPAGVLREFGEMAYHRGLSPTALSPGYGLAEATLAVSIDPLNAAWTSRHVDTESLGAGLWREVSDGGSELVSCGPPVAGLEVRIAGGGELGELEVRGPSLLSHYVGTDRPALTSDGWFHTADLATVCEGSVYVVGRTDDVFVVAGRNVDARALDAEAATHPACRPGNVACVADPGRRYVVVAEPRQAEVEPADLRSAAREIRRLLARRVGAGPSAVVFIERGSLPKTPSGKIRRNHLGARWADGTLPVIASD